MRVLGISAFYHDSAAALVVDGDVAAAAQEERFTRRKHDARFPAHAVAYCLEHAGARLSELDAVVFYEKPLVKFERLLETYLSFAPRGFRSFAMAMPVWLREKLFQKQVLARELRKLDPGFDGARLLFSEHHLSHAASAFYPSPFEEAAVLTMDGVGEWATTSLAVGRGNRLEVLKEMHFPHSIGLLYSAFTYYLGFKVNSGEYKVMGLAPYGEPRYIDRILEHMVDLKPDGSFHLDQRYFDYCTGLTMTSDAFARLFGKPVRNPESELLTQFHMDMAASIQAVTEEIVLRLARSVRAETGQRNLCLAGGVALNCVANGRIRREGLFDNVWVQPASGDAGGALGAALVGYHTFFGRPRMPRTAEPDGMHGAYLGPAFDEGAIAAALTKAGARYTTLDQKARRWPMARQWAGCRAAWSTGRARSAPARSWATRARPPCRRRSISR
jgi:carbamoyltransferase